MKKIILLLTVVLIACTGFSQELAQAISEGNLQKVKSLLDKDPGLLNTKDRLGLTPLNKAVSEAKTDIALELIKRGADPMIGDNENTLPLHQAARTGDIQLFELLLSQAKEIDTRDNNGITPLFYSIEGKQPAMTKYIIEKGADVKAVTNNRWPTLLYAAIYGPVETVKLLIEKGADVNAKNNFGIIPLYSAVSFGRTDIVKLLVENGSKIEEPNDHNETPIFWARNANTFDAAKYLIDKGAKVTRKDNFGRTPLMSVAGRGSINVAQLFLDHGDDINAIDSNGYTALNHTVFSRNPDGMSKFLILNGADVNPRACTRVKNTGCCGCETSPLHSAASYGQLAVTKNLVNSGAKINILDKDGVTPLYLAVKKGSIDVVRYLLDQGAFIDVKEKNLGYTELLLAVTLGQRDIADLLIERGADVKAIDNEGRTAIDLAYYYGHKEIAYTLLMKGAPDGKLKDYAIRPNPANESLGEKEALVWFLGHGGWAIKTRNHLMIFDYFINPNDKAPADSSLASGFINPEELKDMKVTVFVSHSHGDHYSKAIFDWKKKIPDINYVLCFNPPDASGEYTYLPVREEKTINGIKISTVRSTDLDGGYLVEVDGLAILQPGDLANREDKLMKAYTDEIDYIASKGLKIDLAFSPIRGCGLGTPQQVKLGIDYLVEKLNPVVFVPMHSGSASLEYRKFAKQLAEDGSKAKVKAVVFRGDHFKYGNGSTISAL